MSTRKLFVLRLRSDAEDDIAELFARHDEGPTPHEVGLSRRTLFRFHDLYMHLIEGADDVPGRLQAARGKADFQELSTRLDDFLVPYAPDRWTDLTDSAARPFYDWSAG